MRCTGCVFRPLIGGEHTDQPSFDVNKGGSARVRNECHENLRITRALFVMIPSSASSRALFNCLGLAPLGFTTAVRRVLQKLYA